MISKKIKRGFTIIETLMAVLVLSLAMAGALALAAHGLDVIITARQEVAAGFLAQDAMEYIRSLRDTNCLSANLTGLCTNSVWLNTSGASTLGTLCGGATGCYIDTLAPFGTAVTSCPANGCPLLNYSNSTNSYTYSSVGTTPTIYTRSIFVQTPISGNADEASTTVLVTWSGASGVVHRVRVHDDIFNWQ